MRVKLEATIVVDTIPEYADAMEKAILAVNDENVESPEVAYQVLSVEVKELARSD